MRSSRLPAAGARVVTVDGRMLRLAKEVRVDVREVEALATSVA